jgi:hypothetical protein
MATMAICGLLGAVTGLVFVLLCIAARGLKVLTEIRDALTINQPSAKSDVESR